MAIFKNIIRLVVCFFILLSNDAFANYTSAHSSKQKPPKAATYKVQKGDGWLAISRKTGVPIEELKAANKQLDGKTLAIGQIIKLPSGKEVQVETEKKVKRTETEKPVIYKVKKSETLYSIAVKHHETMKHIRQWNNLKADKLHVGQSLIVGYEQVSKKEPEVTEKKVSQPLVEKKPAPKIDSSLIEKHVKKDTVKKIIAEVKNSDTVKTAPKEEKKPVMKGRELEERGMASFIEDEDVNPKKYYALHRTAATGTIIKVTNIMNNSQIYVKVIGQLPDTGDNNDLVIKISKAAAKKLNVIDLRFQVVLNYFAE